jgi:hypothetical protein
MTVPSIESSADRMADADQSSLFDFYDHLDLNRDVERELRYTDGGAGMLTNRLTKDFDRQVRKTIP